MTTNGMTVIEQNTMEAIQSINQKMPEVTLRDLFAMNALCGLLMTPKTGEPTYFAKLSHERCRPMIKARKNK